MITRIWHGRTKPENASKVKDYVRQLEQLYHGGSWQAESFVEKLKDVDEVKAFKEPYPGVHSIA